MVICLPPASLSRHFRRLWVTQFHSTMPPGLWGFHGNLDFLESSLQQHVTSVNLPVRTLNSKVNEKKLTYDGVDLMG